VPFAEPRSSSNAYISHIEVVISWLSKQVPLIAVIIFQGKLNRKEGLHHGGAKHAVVTQQNNTLTVRNKLTTEVCFTKTYEGRTKPL
jgi:hypothetical protein